MGTILGNYSKPSYIYAFLQKYDDIANVLDVKNKWNETPMHIYPGASWST